MYELTHYINGEHLKGTSGRLGDVLNPATGEVQGTCPLATKSEVDKAIKIAATAQPAWAAINPQRRSRVMMKFVQLLNRDMQKLAEVLSREHGKTLPDAAGDVQRGLEVVEFDTSILGMSLAVSHKFVRVEWIFGYSLGAPRRSQYD